MVKPEAEDAPAAETDPEADPESTLPLADTAPDAETAALESKAPIAQAPLLLSMGQRTPFKVVNP